MNEVLNSVSWTGTEWFLESRMFRFTLYTGVWQGSMKITRNEVVRKFPEVPSTHEPSEDTFSGAGCSQIPIFTLSPFPTIASCARVVMGSLNCNNLHYTSLLFINWVTPCKPAAVYGRMILGLFLIWTHKDRWSLSLGRGAHLLRYNSGDTRYNRYGSGTLLWC